MSNVVTNNINPRSGDTISINGSVSIGGTLTYEDVTNIDSVGIITAQSGIELTGGVLSVPDGSESTPSIQFSGSGTDTGFYSPAADEVAVSTGGSGRLFIDSSGKVGVGISSPGTTLDISAAQAIVRATSSTGTNYVLYSGTNGTGSSRMGVETNTGGGLLFGSSANSTIFGSSSNHPLHLGTNSTTALTIDTSQRVGIGTTSPGDSHASAQDLVIGDYSSNGVGISINTTTNGSGNIYFGDASGSNRRGRIEYDHTNDAFRLYTADIERVRIDSSGRLLVGTPTSPFNSARDRLVVESAAGGNVAGAFKNYGGSGAQVADFWNATTTGDAGFVNFLTETSITNRGSIDYNRAAGQVRYNVTSDRRLKSNIQDSGSAIGVVKQIKVRSYTWTETGYQVPFGFIAQELNKIAPDAVKVGDDQEEITDTWSVDNSKLVPMLTAALQEALAEIESLKARVTALEP